MTRPSGDDRSVSRSAIFGVVRRTLFVLHMCGLFHYMCLTDFSFAYILLTFYYIVCYKLFCINTQGEVNNGRWYSRYVSDNAICDSDTSLDVALVC